MREIALMIRSMMLSKPIRELFLGHQYHVMQKDAFGFMIRLFYVFKDIHKGEFILIKEHQEPLAVLLTIEEFYRLKAIEEHLEDREIARIIEERVTNKRHVSQDATLHERFEALREDIYTPAQNTVLHEELK